MGLEDGAVEGVVEVAEVVEAGAELAVVELAAAEELPEVLGAEAAEAAEGGESMSSGHPGRRHSQRTFTWPTALLLGPLKRPFDDVVRLSRSCGTTKNQTVQLL